MKNLLPCNNHPFIRRIAIFGLLFLLLVALTGCLAPHVNILSDEEADAFASEVDEMVTNMLEGLSENDYDKLTRDFDEGMRDAVDEVEGFPQIYDDIIGIVGQYKSHSVSSVFDQGSYRIALYDTVFEHDSEVTTRVVFQEGEGQWLITGLWFDSPALREPAE
nr:hypothetical protein [Anaerolineae bacterium]